MYIRQVKAAELDELHKLINNHVLDPLRLSDEQYRSNLEQSGFLIGKLDRGQMDKLLDRVFLVVKDRKKLVGYLRIDEGIDEEFSDLDAQGFIDWVHTDFKKYYYALPHFEVGGVLVSKGFGRKNIAGSLLFKAMEALKYRNLKHLFSFVPVAPVRNEPSLGFHLKNGFKIIAKLQPVRLWGMEHYQSVLLMKESDWV